MPGVAAGDAPQAATCSKEGAVFFHGGDHVVATGGVKTAIPADERAEGVLIDAHHSNHSKCRQSGDEV